MSPGAQRIAIAKACGWKRIEQYPEARTDGSDNWIEDYMGSKNGVRTCIPDYLHDLNACHEAEEVLHNRGPSTWQRYGAALQESANYYCVGFIPDYPRHLGSLASIAHATASQRCEAFLRTLNLWKDNQ